MSYYQECLICIGSNHNSEANISSVVESLSRMFPDIRWGETVFTLPEGPLPERSSPSCPDALYHNKAALFTTPLSYHELKAMFREIEKACGRTPSSKSCGIIPIDIDILRLGSTVFKPQDMERKYVRQALQTLL